MRYRPVGAALDLGEAVLTLPEGGGEGYPRIVGTSRWDPFFGIITDDYRAAVRRDFSKHRYVKA